ncbi:MAG TPA: AzlD domain-containing protein [Kineosporiaceae bacterium]|nr:AzlD domain-containing protein [Kineosporiaceae bacterium]
MSTWTAVLAACAACFALKLAGYVAPEAWLDRPRVVRIAGLVTVALLAALVAVQTLATGRQLHLDARLPALGVAALLLWRRAPFVVVVAAAAVTAALLRLLA